jgi:hypothetical protein
MNKIRLYLLKLKIFLPLFFALILLNLPNNIFNPGGILCLIPIFYYFIYNPKYMNFLMVFFLLLLLDYYQNQNVLWSFLFICFYVALSIQKTIIIKNQNMNSFVFFIVFVAAGCLIQFISIILSVSLEWVDIMKIFGKELWVIVLLSALYIPFSFIFNKIKIDDRQRA